MKCEALLGRAHVELDRGDSRGRGRHLRRDQPERPRRTRSRREDDLDTRVEFVAFGAEEVGPPGDQWPLVRRGVPGYFVASVRETEGLGRGRGWGHTAADTLDKLDARNLPEQALLLTELALDLASDDAVVEHREPPEVAATFERTGRDEESKARDDWPFG